MRNSPCTSLLLRHRSLPCTDTFSSHIHCPSQHRPDGGEKNQSPGAHTCMSTVCRATLLCISHGIFLPDKAIARISPHLRSGLASREGEESGHGAAQRTEMEDPGRNRVQRLSSCLGRTASDQHNLPLTPPPPAHAKPHGSSGFPGGCREQPGPPHTRSFGLTLNYMYQN